jgi:hypothetical protein
MPASNAKASCAICFLTRSARITSPKASATVGSNEPARRGAVAFFDADEGVVGTWQICRHEDLLATAYKPYNPRTNELRASGIG